MDPQRPMFPERKNPKIDESLTEAITLVNGARQEKYGHPYDDFTRTAKMMSGIGFRFLDPHTNTPRELTAEDIPIFMIMVKLSREVHQHQEDNLTDMHGYTKCLEMVIRERKNREKVSPA